MNAFLEAWHNLQILQPPPIDFTLVYRQLDGSPEREASATSGEVVREDLNEYLTLLRCVATLLETYPLQRFSSEQISRCLFIFWTVTQNATMIEMPSDAVVEFGFESYYPPGHFQVPRSKVLQDLLNAPEVVVLCFDVGGRDEEGPSFTLLQLLTEDAAYDTFITAWEALPSYDFTREAHIVDKPVKIERVDRAMEETAKMNKQLLQGMQGMTSNFQGYTEDLTQKTDALAKLVSEEQHRVLAEHRGVLEEHRKKLEAQTAALKEANEMNKLTEKKWKKKAKKQRKKARVAKKKLKKALKKVEKMKV